MQETLWYTAGLSVSLHLVQDASQAPHVRGAADLERRPAQRVLGAALDGLGRHVVERANLGDTASVAGVFALPSMRRIRRCAQRHESRHKKM